LCALNSGAAIFAASRSAIDSQHIPDSSRYWGAKRQRENSSRLFQDSKGFPNDPSRAVQTQAADIDPHTLSAQIAFTDLRDGVYAVSMFHDENMNQKLDKNLVGLPKEGYGASNNLRKKMGPPTFEETRFQLSGAQSVEIKLIY
jgi:uncharacterized protein (DUF2141 family)